MFQRIVTGDSTAFCEIAAFGFAASIFVTFCWRALRMAPAQADHLAELPFATDTQPARPPPKAAEGKAGGTDHQP